jgi:hypothetical protein
MSYRALTAAAVALAATAASAQNLASDKQWELRAGLSLLWYQNASNNSGLDTVGGLPLELGVGFRPTPQTSLALFVRAGLVHVGLGLELAFTPGSDWSQSGLVMRLGGVAILDAFTCFTIDGPQSCDHANYFDGELTIGYRWAFKSTGGFSIGMAGTMGNQRLVLDGGGVERHFAFGFLVPRMQFDF